MLMLCNIALVCGAAYLGIRGASNYRAKRNQSWLLKPSDHLKRDLKPGSTRVYIVRSWQERGWLSSAAVTRYALEEPSTVKRFGYASSEALLESLSAGLNRVQRMEGEADQTHFASIPAVAV